MVTAAPPRRAGPESLTVAGASRSLPTATVEIWSALAATVAMAKDPGIGEKPAGTEVLNVVTPGLFGWNSAFCTPTTDTGDPVTVPIAGLEELRLTTTGSRPPRTVSPAAARWVTGSRYAAPTWMGVPVDRVLVVKAGGVTAK